MDIVEFLSLWRVEQNKYGKQVIVNPNLTLAKERQFLQVSFAFERLAPAKGRIKLPPELPDPCFVLVFCRT